MPPRRCRNCLLTRMDHCPGLYCGRSLLVTGNWSECGACPRGFRTNSTHCVLCVDHPEFYDWLYLAFMFFVALVLHWFCIDFLTERQGLRNVFTVKREVSMLYVSALVEVCAAAIITILVVDPVGSFLIRSCKTIHMSDWYTLFYNPTPNYDETLYCTQEAVYPLYTMVFIFYALATAITLLLRPKYHSLGKQTIYAALYFYPILACFQAVFGGIIYYTFPYIVIIASLMSSATHLAHKEEDAMFSLILDIVKDGRNIVILIGHWLFHAYGIIAVTELKEPKFHWAMMALVPLPTVFYILTSKFTDPVNIE